MSIPHKSIPVGDGDQRHDLAAGLYIILVLLKQHSVHARAYVDFKALVLDTSRHFALA